MANPRVTVMLPSYNHEKYIAEAIESCLNQTFTDFEIMMSDDCSPDDTVAVARQFQDKRIRIHQFEHNVGATENHYYCFSHANGEYIALLNSDDAWLPDHLGKKVAYLDAHPECGAVFSWSMAIDENGDVLDPCMEVFRQPNRTREEWLLRLFTGGNCICHPSMLIRKEVYQQVGFYSHTLRQLPDFEQWIRVLKKYSIYIIQEVQVKHRRCIHTMTNTSAPVISNSIRDVNESAMILRHFFDGMDDSLFRNAFHSIFRDPNAAAHEELLCEKFFLMLDGKYYMTPVTPLAAYQFFLENCNNRAVLRVMKEKYGYTLSDFFALGSKLDVYRIGEEAERAQAAMSAPQQPVSQEIGFVQPFTRKNRLKAIAWALFGEGSRIYRFLQKLYQKLA